jgi:hypothetical protein
MLKCQVGQFEVAKRRFKGSDVRPTSINSCGFNSWASLILSTTLFSKEAKDLLGLKSEWIMFLIAYEFIIFFQSIIGSP